MELNNNVHAFNSSRYVHVRYRRSIALSCPNEASRFETSPIQLCASKFRLKKERNIRSRTSRSTFPTSPHFPIFPNSFSIHSLSLERENRELRFIRIGLSFPVFAILSRLLLQIRFIPYRNDFRILLFATRPFQPLVSSIPFTNPSLRCKLEEFTGGDEYESKFFFPHLARCDKNGKMNEEREINLPRSS